MMCDKFKRVKNFNIQIKETEKDIIFLRKLIMLALKNISVQFGGIKALSDVSFKVEKNSLFSIIGPNGAGKTTLLNVISGRYKPISGEIYYQGKNLNLLHLQDQLNKNPFVKKNLLKEFYYRCLQIDWKN